MPDAARAQVLAYAAGKTTALPEDATLATLCAAQAERTPDAVALCFGEEQLSYATLHGRAMRLASALQAERRIAGRNLDFPSGRSPFRGPDASCTRR